MEIEKWSEYVDKYVAGEDSISDELRDQLAKKPVFLLRNVRARRQQVKKQESEAKKLASSSSNDASNGNGGAPCNKSPCTNDESTNDEVPFSAAAMGGAAAALGPSSALVAAAKTDMVDDTQCKFNLNSYKMVFVVNSSSYIYNRRALRRAQQSHRKVSQRMHRSFGQWHQGWLDRSVSSEQSSMCEDWLLGLGYECTTNCIQVQDCSRPPYRPFRRFRTSPLVRS